MKLIITESQYNALKKSLIEDVAIRKPELQGKNDNLKVYTPNPNAERYESQPDVNESNGTNEQFANINFKLNGKSYITGAIINEKFYEVIRGNAQGVIQIDIHSYEGGEVDKNPNLAAFLEFVYNDGGKSRLSFYSRGKNQGELLDLLEDDTWKAYISKHLIDKTSVYAAQKIAELKA